MKTAIALSLGLFLVVPAFAATFDAGPADVPQIPWPTHASDTDCSSNQGAVVNGSLGINANTAPVVQGPCIPGGSGSPADLIGFAFPVVSCQDGFVKTTRVQFNIADAGDLWQLYLWREQGGIPLDACGLECGVATPLTIPAVGPVVVSHDWTQQQCPCLTFNGERIHIGTVYVNVALTVADWYVGRENSPFGAGFGYGNLSGDHDDWQDLDLFGFGNHWGVENIIGTECGTVPVESTTWGTVKTLYE